MALVSILPELIKARDGGYAIPCFDTVEMLGTEGIFAALEEEKAPGIVAIYTGAFDRPNAGAFIEYVKSMADRANVPVSLMLDHGATFEHCVRAIKAGFTDVMYDGSRLPLQENIANTKKVVQMAHAVGASVEAELGHVGRGSEYQSFGAKRKGFTDPDVVEQFLAETSVDSLAIAIGTAHGVYQGDPELDLELLAEIRRRVDVPLVLHGGSGLSDKQFRSAIEGGINKINIFTDLTRAATQMAIDVAHSDSPSYFAFTRAITEGFKTRCKHYLKLFGASGRALANRIQ